jgi:hypothetical protein
MKSSEILDLVKKIHNRDLLSVLVRRRRIYHSGNAGSANPFSDAEAPQPLPVTLTKQQIESFHIRIFRNMADVGTKKSGAGCAGK